MFKKNWKWTELHSNILLDNRPSTLSFEKRDGERKKDTPLEPGFNSAGLLNMSEKKSQRRRAGEERKEIGELLLRSSQSTFEEVNVESWAWESNEEKLACEDSEHDNIGWISLKSQVIGRALTDTQRHTETPTHLCTPSHTFKMKSVESNDQWNTKLWSVSFTFIFVSKSLFSLSSSEEFHYSYPLLPTWTSSPSPSLLFLSLSFSSSSFLCMRRPLSSILIVLSRSPSLSHTHTPCP